MYNILFFRSKDFVESTEKDYIDKFKALSQYDMASLYTFFNQLSERYFLTDSLWQIEDYNILY